MLKDADASEIRNNYLRLSRLVHPDKCSHPNAAEASSILNMAKDTLTNPLKKKLYDSYVTDVTEGGAETSEMTYAEWEAAQAQYPVKIPAWLEKILRIPVVGQVIALIVLLCLFPLVLLVILLVLVLWLVCLPINILVRCCCGAAIDEQAERQRAAFAQQAAAGGQAYSPPPQQPTPGAANV